MATSYGNYGQQTVSGANVGGYGGYSSYPVAYPSGAAAAPVAYVSQQPAYGGLAGYGAPRAAASYYNQASYSTSLSGDALAYATQPAYAQPAGSYRQSQYSAGPVLSGLPAASSYGGVSGGIEQYGANALAPQIEAAYEAAALHRRQPVIRRQVIQVPGNPGQVKQIVRRVPTPIPDVIERVFVVKPQRDIVNLVIERPTTPPPQIKNRTIVAKSRKPVINSQVVRVAPRSIQAPPAPAPVQVQPPVQYAPAPVQYAPAPVQYAPAPVQYAPAPAPAYEYGSAYSYTSSFDTVTGGYPQQQYGGYSTGYPANYGLPAYAGASSYSQPYNYSYAQPSASYPVGYATQSNAYSSAYQPQQNGSSGAYPSIIAANPAGNSYYGYGYPATAQYGYAPRY